MTRYKTSGFTLIELMIVVAIVGILTAISIGFYGNYVTKANRTDGRSALSSISASLEKCKALYGAYDNANCTSVIPAASSENLYTITSVRTASTFTLTATATGNQASDADCTSMTITNTGIKGGAGATPSECW